MYATPAGSGDAGEKRDVAIVCTSCAWSVTTASDADLRPSRTPRSLVRDASTTVRAVARAASRSFEASRGSACEGPEVRIRNRRLRSAMTHRDPLRDRAGRPMLKHLP
jgi:hypothetical protein